MVAKFTASGGRIYSPDGSFVATTDIHRGGKYDDFSEEIAQIIAYALTERLRENPVLWPPVVKNREMGGA